MKMNPEQEPEEPTRGPERKPGPLIFFVDAVNLDNGIYERSPIGITHHAGAMLAGSQLLDGGGDYAEVFKM